MKCEELQKICDAAAEVAPSSAALGWRAAARIFGATPKAAAAARLKAIAAAPPTAVMRSCDDLDAFERSVEAMAALMALVGKRAAVSDLTALGDCLKARRAYGLEGLMAAAESAERGPQPRSHALNAALVDRYLPLLEEALGAERFETVYADLKAERGLKAAEAKALARAFTSRPGRGKSDALERIWARHVNAKDGDARVRASGGRSAA